MENFQTICKESKTILDEEEEERDEFASIIEDGDDEDYVQTLLDGELASSGIQMQESWSDWVSAVRLDGIHYILEKREFLGLRFETAYLSVTYLDRFLSRKPNAAEKSWAIRLLSMACLSLAAKMEESTVRPLSEFCSEDFNFASRFIQNMELLVLNTLDWRMGLVTPFAFIHFFAKKFYENRSRNGVSRIVEVILSAMRDEKIMCHKPSVIAASATLVALDNRSTRHALELRINPLTSSGVLEIEDFIACYEQIQELDPGKLLLNDSNQEINSRDISPIHLPQGDAHGSSSADFVSGVNRRRLEFKESDQIDDLPNKKPKH